jgi:hypothetical protein
MWGLLAGVLGLVALDAVTTVKGSGSFGQFTGVVGTAIAWLTSNTVPGIPDLTQSQAAQVGAAQAKAGAAASAGTGPAIQGPVASGGGNLPGNANNIPGQPTTGPGTAVDPSGSPAT